MIARENYPAWICPSCGEKHGRLPRGHLATFHQSQDHEVCGWCGRGDVPLTEPRDYRWPRVPVDE